MAVVTENAQHEFAPQKNKPPSEDEKRYFSLFFDIFYLFYVLALLVVFCMLFLWENKGR